MSISELVRIVNPAENPSKIPDASWSEAESRFRKRLPADYRDLLEVFGPGTLNEFLHVAGPFSANPYLNVSDRLRLLHKAEKLKKLNFPKDPVSLVHPFLLHPESPGLIPWGITDNGDDLFWHTLGEPDAWPVVIYNGRSGDYESHPMSMTTFLSSILSGRLQVSFFPKDFFMEAPVFSPNPDGNIPDS